MSNQVLLVDFGSTYTKLTAIDMRVEKIIATSKAYTTVETNVLDGYEKALNDLLSKSDLEMQFDEIIACSSAAGGLKMAAIGLVETLTVEAAKRACLGAGAKVESIFTNHLTNMDIKKIVSEKIDIILLAGGTDGGNSECILFNANKIASANLNIPVIVAGNKNCNDEIEDIFLKNNIEYKICNNVMPRVNELYVDDAKEAIRELFASKIIEAKGIKKAEEKIGSVIMPTPEAVLVAAEYLSKGYEDEAGLGDIVVVDIGGATTDIHSIGLGHPKKQNVVLKGLLEPYAKRTVEGDLGMRYSAMSIYSALKGTSTEKYFGDMSSEDIKKECQKRIDDVEFIPTLKEDKKFDISLSKVCTDLAISRHAGTLNVEFTPLGKMYYQFGKDLTDFKYVIGTGGVIVNNENPKEILEIALSKLDNSIELRPKEPKFAVDKEYILSAMGILATKYPKKAIKIMKMNLLEM